MRNLSFTAKLARNEYIRVGLVRFRGKVRKTWEKIALLLYMYKYDIGAISTLPMDLIRDMWGYFQDYPNEAKFIEFIASMHQHIQNW